jgi:hypothetical protein
VKLKAFPAGAVVRLALYRYPPHREKSPLLAGWGLGEGVNEKSSISVTINNTHEQHCLGCCIIRTGEEVIATNLAWNPASVTLTKMAAAMA